MSIKAAQAPTRRERLEAKENAILRAAREAFVAQGADGARVADIARHAGVAEGTVYLYYKTKTALMQAVLADFWDELTAGAWEAVRGEDRTFDALEALATFHLGKIIEEFDYVALTLSIRGRPSDTNSTQAQMRTYVAVFDTIFRRGQDRGDLHKDVPLWIPRDHFYGTLEFSARTILQHPKRRQADVIATLMESFRLSFGSERISDGGKTGSGGELLGRLEAAVERLERLDPSTLR